MTTTSIERRAALGNFTLRAEGDEAPELTGLPVVYGKRTWIGSKDYGYWEQVDPGACAKALDRPDDVRLLRDHDPRLLLARTASGTLELTEGDDGLHCRSELNPADPDVVSTVAKMRRGDLTGMSFAFAIDGEAYERLDDGKWLYRITDLTLYDVSVVTYPAYADTEASLRASAERVLARAAALTAPDEALVRHAARQRRHDLRGRAFGAEYRRAA